MKNRKVLVSTLIWDMYDKPAVAISNDVYETINIKLREQSFISERLQTMARMSSLIFINFIEYILKNGKV